MTHQLVIFISIWLATLFSDVWNIVEPAQHSKMADKVEAPARPMKFPYTMTSKVVQFPWKYYLSNNWVYRYYFIALAVTFPVFYKIHSAANSPGNKAKWAEQKRKEAAAEHH